MGYAEDFPDFVLDVKLPPGFEDISWKNDDCPSFRSVDLNLILFVDYELRSYREHPTTDRFNLYHCDDDGHIGEYAGGGDSWDEVLFFVEQRRRLHERLLENEDRLHG